MPRELPRRVDRAAIGERLAALPADPDPQPGTDEYQVISWLTRLHLLQGVPFGYLVPDIGMLPVESVRFFQVDNAWVEALIDGAFAVAAPAATAVAGTTLRAKTMPAVRARLRHVRTTLLNGAPPATAAPPANAAPAASVAPEPITGFLLRSAVVSGWPGMEVRCYADTRAQRPLPLLRLERVAPALLLCLVGGLLRRVDLQEPPEGVHFGVDPAPPSSPTPWCKQLRYASGDDSTPVGSWITGAVQPVPLRPESATVLRVDALAQAMAPQVWVAPPPSPASFTAAQFGLEMTEGVQSVSFQVGS